MCFVVVIMDITRSKKRHVASVQQGTIGTVLHVPQTKYVNKIMHGTLNLTHVGQSWLNVELIKGGTELSVFALITMTE